MFKNIKILFNFFPSKLKNKLFMIQIIVLVSSFLEVSTVFLIGPVVELASLNDITEGSFIVKTLYNFFNFENYHSFLIFLICSLIIIIFISTLIIVISVYIFTKFSQELGNILRTKLYSFFILQPWIFHSQSSNSTYLNKIIHEANRVSWNIILQILLTNAKVFTALIIICGLIIYNPKVTLICLFIFSTSYILFFKLLKNSMQKAGESMSTTQGKMFQVINESFNGIREAIIYGKQMDFYKKFSSSSFIYAKSLQKISLLGIVPRYILELIAFLVVFIFFLIFAINNQSINLLTALPILATYAFAGYKLLPIFQQIYFGFVQIKSNYSALESVSGELESITRNKPNFNNKNELKETLPILNNITFNNVSYNYKNSERIAVDNIYIKITRNSINAIVGPSGSGKTTLLDMFLGLLQPQNGNIEIDDKKLDVNDIRKWQNNISYVGQNVFLLDDTIKKNICFNLDDDQIDTEKFKNALIISDVSSFLKEIKDAEDTIVGERGIKLSGGQRQRVAIARALYHDKDIIVFDEATNSLDGISEKFIIDKLNTLSKSKIILMVTHNIRLTKSADRIHLLNGGKVLQSGVFSELTNNDVFNKLLNE